MLMTQDLEAIQRITGFQTENEVYAIKGLEEEYSQQLRMYNRAAAEGRGKALPPIMLIPILRGLGFRLPSESARVEKPKPPNWAIVKDNTPVMVTRVVMIKGVQTKQRVLGKFLGLISASGTAAVKHGDNPYVEQYQTTQMELAPSTIPGDVKVDGADFRKSPRDALIEEEIASQFDEVEETKNQRPDSADPTRPAPIINLPAFWYNVDPMSEVEGIGRGNKIFQGHFVDVGPTDGYIQVMLNKDDRVNQRVMPVRAIDVKQGWSPDFFDVAADGGDSQGVEAGAEEVTA